MLTTLGVFVLVTACLGGAAGAGTAGGQTKDAREVQARLDDYLRNIPGSRQIGPHEIVWEIAGLGEAGIVVPGGAALAACPRNKFCFYEHRDYQGELRHYPPCRRPGVDYYLEGFRDTTSSWKNTTGRTAWMYDLKFPIRDRLWTMNPGHDSPYVGDDKNDKADYYRC